MKDKNNANMIEEDNLAEFDDELLSPIDGDEQPLDLNAISETTPVDDNRTEADNPSDLSSITSSIDETILLEGEDDISDGDEDIVELTDIAYSDERDDAILLSDIDDNSLENEAIIELGQNDSTTEETPFSEEFFNEPTADLSDARLNSVQLSQESILLSDAQAQFLSNTEMMWTDTPKQKTPDFLSDQTSDKGAKAAAEPENERPKPSNESRTDLSAPKRQEYILPIEQEQDSFNNLLTEIEKERGLPKSDLILPDNMDDLLIPADDGDSTAAETSAIQDILIKDDTIPPFSDTKDTVSDPLVSDPLDDLLVPADEDDILTDSLTKHPHILEADILESALYKAQNETALSEPDISKDALEPPLKTTIPPADQDDVPISIDDIIDLADVKPSEQSDLLYDPLLSDQEETEKKEDEIIDLIENVSTEDLTMLAPGMINIKAEPAEKRLLKQEEESNPFEEKTLLIKELDERLDTTKVPESVDTDEKTLLVSDLDDIRTMGASEDYKNNEKTMLVTDLDEQPEPEDIIDLVEIKVLPEDTHLDSLSEPIEEVVPEGPVLESKPDKETKSSVSMESFISESSLESQPESAEDAFKNAIGLIDILSAPVQSSDQVDSTENFFEKDILDPLQQEDTLPDPLEPALKKTDISTNASETRVYDAKDKQRGSSTSDKIDAIAKEFSLPQEQVEAVLERVIRNMFAEKIERVLMGIIEKAVAKELNRLKNLLIDDLTREV